MNVGVKLRDFKRLLVFEELKWLWVVVSVWVFLKEIRMCWYGKSIFWFLLLIVGCVIVFMFFGLREIFGKLGSINEWILGFFCKKKNFFEVLLWL